MVEDYFNEHTNFRTFQIDSDSPTAFCLSLTSQVSLNTILHADEILAESRFDGRLRTKNFLTSDGLAYAFESPGLVVYYTRKNPVFENLPDATKKIFSHRSGHGWYGLKQEGLEELRQFDDVLRIPMSDLKLKEIQEGWPCFYIEPSTYETQLNESQKELAKRIIGGNKNFATNMQMLRELESKIGLYFPTEEEVRHRIKRTGGVAIASFPILTWEWKKENCREFHADGLCLSSSWHIRGEPIERRSLEFSKEEFMTVVNDLLQLPTVELEKRAKAIWQKGQYIPVKDAIE